MSASSAMTDELTCSSCIGCSKRRLRKFCRKAGHKSTRPGTGRLTAQFSVKSVFGRPRRLVEAAADGRRLAHSAEAQARRTEARRRDLEALQVWKATDQPVWLTEQFYSAEIQPRLRRLTLSRISEDLSVSHPYAPNIRSGRRRLHPRHWLILAGLLDIQNGREHGDCT